MKLCMKHWVVAALALGAGCAPMSKQHLYDIAVAAVKADSAFPVQAEIRPKKYAEFYIGKNAGCVVIAYDAVDASGAKRKENHTVWLKRIGTRWEIDRMFPTPTYPGPDERSPFPKVSG